MCLGTALCGWLAREGIFISLSITPQPLRPQPTVLYVPFSVDDDLCIELKLSDRVLIVQSSCMVSYASFSLENSAWGGGGTLMDSHRGKRDTVVWFWGVIDGSYFLSILSDSCLVWKWEVLATPFAHHGTARPCIPHCMGCALKTVRQSEHSLPQVAACEVFGYSNKQRSLACLYSREPRSFWARNYTSRSDVSHRYGTSRGDRTSASNRHLRRVRYIPNIPLMLK